MRSGGSIASGGKVLRRTRRKEAIGRGRRKGTGRGALGRERFGRRKVFLWTLRNVAIGMSIVVSVIVVVLTGGVGGVVA